MRSLVVFGFSIAIYAMTGSAQADFYLNCRLMNQADPLWSQHCKALNLVRFICRDRLACLALKKKLLSAGVPADAIQSTSTTDGQPVANVGRAVSNSGSNLGSAVSSTSGTIGGGVANTGNALGGTVRGAGNTVGDAVGGPVGGVTSGAANTAGGTVQGAGQTAGGAVNQTGSTVGGTVSGAGRALGL